MPIGASKVGALGGLVPGGSVTFNASGTWDVPPGVKIVSVTGKGGTGNPGNAGNQGNPGNPGNGGSGGGAGGNICGTFPGWTQSTGIAMGKGGTAFDGPANTALPMPVPYEAASPTRRNGGPPGNPGAPANPGTSGTAGNSGTAGTAGNAGQPGNPGCSSSALGNTFPGGAGGNAGAGGAAGNGGGPGPAGLGGQGGNRQPPGPGANLRQGGAGSCGGGSGGQGWPKGASWGNPVNTSFAWTSGWGGGGAGATNSGQTGVNSFVRNNPSSVNDFPNTVAPWRTGGTTASASAALPNAINPGKCGAQNLPPGISPIPAGATNLTGGFSWATNNPVGFQDTNAIFLCRAPKTAPIVPRLQAPAWSGPCISAIFRSGGGGGGAGYWQFNGDPSNYPIGLGFAPAGGGSGGGRGGAGNSAGPTPTPSGVVATPVTFNCVPVTPGTPTPITVASPGGQVVISWNPQ